MTADWLPGLPSEACVCEARIRGPYSDIWGPVMRFVFTGDELTDPFVRGAEEGADPDDVGGCQWQWRPIPDAVP